MRAAHPVRSTEAARTRPNRRFIDTLDPPIYLSIIVPTYEYQCEKCQRVFEIRQRITEPALTICEVCGGHVKRLLSAAPFILKGEGWYVTDYPSESRKKARDSEKAATDKPAAKADGAKTDGAKTEGAKSEGAKSDGGKTDAAAASSSSSSTSSAASPPPPAPPRPACPRPPFPAAHAGAWRRCPPAPRSPAARRSRSARRGDRPTGHRRSRPAAPRGRRPGRRGRRSPAPA